MRLCSDCRFYKAEGDKHLCTAILDLVTGEQKDVDCYEARAAEWLCGNDAKLFKDPERVLTKLVDDPGSASGKRIEHVTVTVNRSGDMKLGRSDG